MQGVFTISTLEVLTHPPPNCTWPMLRPAPSFVFTLLRSTVVPTTAMLWSNPTFIHLVSHSQIQKKKKINGNLENILHYRQRYGFPLFSCACVIFETVPEVTTTIVQQQLQINIKSSAGSVSLFLFK